jgi:hypothetical protein
VTQEDPKAADANADADANANAEADANADADADADANANANADANANANADADATADVSEAKDPSPDEPATVTAPKTDDDDTDAIFETLWDRIDAAWDDEKTHAALLEYALRTEMLPQLAGRYRKVKDASPERAERAQKKIDGIIVALTHVMMSQKSPLPQKVPWQLTLSVGLACMLALLYLARIMLFVR